MFGAESEDKDAPSPREGHSCAFVGHRLFIFGGYNCMLLFRCSETNSTKKQSNLSTWMTSIPLISVISSFHTHLIRVADVKKWTRINTDTDKFKPSPRKGHTCTPVGKLLFFFGGSRQNQLFDDVSVFDTGIQSLWKQHNSCSQMIPFHF